MDNLKEAFDKPRLVALYSSMDLTGYFSVFEVAYRNYDEQYNTLPNGEKREVQRSGYVRISKPVEVPFACITDDEVIQQAVANLDAQEREAIEELNKKVASIRERKSQLLAITFQPDIVS